MLMLFVVSVGAASAQNMTVSGVISDAQTREPVVGASVVANGTTATISDGNGRYSINVPNGTAATLTVSFLGYRTQEVRVTGSQMDIYLESQSFEVDEVVIVGTVMRKSDLTGAVSGVSAKVLAEKPVTTINQAIQGRVAGVFITQGAKPTDEASIRIRGINTIDGSTKPIFVVDGLVMDDWYGGFSAVNLNDVASIEVLKDASATALYGSRGSNGVVVITTKKGRSGEGRVTYDGWVGIQSFGYQPKLMNQQQLLDIRSEAYTNGYIQKYISDNGSSPSAADIQNYVTNNIDSGTSVISQLERDAIAAGKSYNWLDAVTRNAGIQHNHVLSFSNGDEKGSFYLSFGYMDNKGIIKKTEQKKYTGRINADSAIKSWLKVGTSTSFTHTDNTKVDDGVFSRARGASPFWAVNDTDLRIGWKDLSDNNAHNPLRSLWIDDDERLNRLVSSNFINVEPIRGLNVRTTLAIDHGSANRNRYIPNDLSESERDSSNGRATDNRDIRTVWQWDNSISYDTVFGKNRLNAMVGTSATSTKTNWINTRADGFSTNDFTYHSMGSNYRHDTYNVSSDWSEQTLMSYIARVNYTYDDRYLVTATARYDGSSKFAKGHKWGIFPSISAAWNIAEENFMDNQNIFDQLKLRVGFGVVGNQNIDDFRYYTLYNVGGNGTQTTGYTPTSTLDNGRRGTPDISWEKQQQWNAGVDMAFLNDRIRLSVDAYLIDNKDLLMTRSLSGITGYQRATENIGAIRNRGIELSLGATIMRNQDFEWNFSGTFSLDRNEVTRLYGGMPYQYNLSDQNIQNEGNLFIGEPRNTFYTLKSAGIAQESDMAYINSLKLGGHKVSPGDLYAVDIDGNGTIDGNADRTIVGSKDPKFYGGFATDFTWKGISMNAVFTYSYGASRLGGWYNSITSGYGNGQTSVDLLDHWTPENTDAKFPRVLAENAGYNRWGQGSMDSSLQDASYLRLSALTLAYNFPARITSAIKMSNLRVYATGTNLFCLTPYKGYDPEYGDSYPAMRMWTFGVNLSF